MRSRIVKIRLPYPELAVALGLPQGSDIKVVTTIDDSVILFIEHPEMQERSGNTPAPELTLDELKRLEV